MNFIPKIEYIELNTLLPKTITFGTPPEGDPYNEEYSASSIVTKSNNGTKQTQFNYLEKSFSLDFIFQSETVKAAVLDFYKKHALQGGKFNYFPSSDEVEFEEFTLADKGIKFSRPIPAATLGEFEYDFKISFEKVESVL